MFLCDHKQLNRAEAGQLLEGKLHQLDCRLSHRLNDTICKFNLVLPS